jgi:hypothetical protein
VTFGFLLQLLLCLAQLPQDFFILALLQPRRDCLNSVLDSLYILGHFALHILDAFEIFNRCTLRGQLLQFL